MKPFNSSLFFPQKLSRDTKPSHHRDFSPSHLQPSLSMMSPENIPTNPTSEDNPTARDGKPPPTTLRPPEQALKCPRCDSSNTKFCYYNNYSLTQPRHFCKTCRRYWTKGGALRNVPIGGGCRKNKKSKSGSRLSGDQKEGSSTSSDKFYHGLSPAMDFQLGGLPFARLQTSSSGAFNQLFSFGDLSSSISPCSASTSASLVGFNYAVQDAGGVNLHSNIASSIENLSSINQDLHWKLQQQRLAMLFGGENQKHSSVSALPTPMIENLQNQQQPTSFQAPESSKKEILMTNTRKSCVGDNTAEWTFETSYNGNSNGNGNTTGNWSEIQTWNDLNQYSALP